MGFSRHAFAIVFALANSCAFAQAKSTGDAEGVRGLCHDFVGDAQFSGGWSDLSREVIENDAAIATARRLDGKFWRLPFENSSWLPIPLGEISALNVRPVGGPLSELVFVDRDHQWMMFFSWFPTASDSNAEPVEKTVALFKAGLARIGTSFDCDGSDLAVVRQTIREMLAVEPLHSGKSIIYSIGQSGALSKTLERAGSGTEWHALLYPAGGRREILSVTWILARSFPYEAFDLPLALALTEQVQSAPEPEWAARFAQALRTRDAEMMSELAKANGWRLVPPLKSSRSKE